MSLNQWSTTPASNDIVNYFQTGMRPSSVKTAGWDIMADLAQILNATPTGGGTANAQTVANPRPFTALTNGLTCVYLPSAPNTGAATFAPDGLTAKPIFANGAALIKGELSTTVPALLKYDNTNWNLLNSCRPFDFVVAAGANSLTASKGAFAAYYDGLRVVFQAPATNTASPTLNINSLGALNIYYSDGTTPLAAGSLIHFNIYEFIYDSALNASTGGFICVNPSPVRGSYTTTFVGGPGTATVNYTIDTDGDGCTLRMPSSTATGTGTALTMTAPAALIPATQQVVPIYAEDASALVNATLVVGTSSPWSFTQANNVTLTGAWTAGGTRGIARAGQLVKYKLIG